MVLLSSSKAKSSVGAWERHMPIARWAGSVRVLSLLLLTSLSAYAQQKGDLPVWSRSVIGARCSSSAADRAARL